MKIRILFLISLMISSACFAGLSLDVNAIYCPNTYYSCTFTVSGDYDGMFFDQSHGTSVGIVPNSRVYNGSVNVTSWSLLVHFNDDPATHSIRFNYEPSVGGNLVQEYFTFIKVKSLTSSQYTPLPGITTITAPYCTNTSTNISFNNLAWHNSTLDADFAPVAQYEYSVPAGWTVDGSTSSGPSDYKLSDNSVTIVSDGATGGLVRIRGVNNACATGLSTTPWYDITIIRAAPSGLTFSGASTICSSEQYEVSGVPGWVTDYLWEVSSSSLVTSGTATTNPATFTKSTSGVGTIKLTISNPSCGASFQYNTLAITGSSELLVGTPKPGIIYKTSEYCIGGTDWDVSFTVSPAIDVSYNWKYNGSLITYNHSATFSTYEFPAVCIDLDLQLETACGTGPWLSADTYGNPATFCPSCGSFRMSVSPNPSSNEITIKSKSPKKPLVIRQIQIVDRMGNIKKLIKGNGGNQFRIMIGDLPTGNYYIRVFDGKEWVTEPFIKK